MKRIAALLLAALMCIALLTGCSQKPQETAGQQNGAKEDFEYIKDKGELIIGITLFAPMNYKDESGELVGFETEFAEAVCEKLGLKPKFQVIQWSAKETELAAKTIDCVWNGMTITEERAQNMDISIPYLMNKQVMVVKAENLEKYSDLANIAGAAVVAEKKSAGESVIQTEEAFKDAKYTAVDTQAKVLMEVAAGTADIGVIDYVMSIGSIGEGTDYADLKVVETADFAEEQYGIAFRKNSPETLEKFNTAIRELAADGTLRAIAEKYKLQDLLIVE